MIDFFFWLVMILFLIVCVFMILLVLIQKGRGGGLASAFGGAGGNTAFGSKTGDVLTWATSIVFGVFLVLAVALNLLATERHERKRPSAPTAAANQQPAPAQNTSSLPNAPSPPPGIVGAQTVENPQTPMNPQMGGATATPPATQPTAAADAPATAPAATQPGAANP